MAQIGEAEAARLANPRTTENMEKTRAEIRITQRENINYQRSII